ncbi:methylamine utilization protein MauJ [Ralstonia solanacearum]|uniref:Uncharacterized protein n=1 Tax=Ralstonia solanacearum TaxID=305 RepID=A0AAE3NJU8_RALSL|nr:methylamine utilization protein MauJ [Ralstonia solanacearum]MBB6582877.1 hypothetical protein [Ralstonia solanacearum]MDB0523066.1 hypothetical protein [Ralstonia solanacearum]
MEPQLFATTTTNKVDFPRPFLNNRERIVIVPIREGEEKPSPSGGPGKYRVIYVLTIPGTALYHRALDFEAIMQSGDSLLRVAPGTAELRFEFQHERGPYRVCAKVNENHRLATMALEFDAENLREAEITAWDVTTPLMSTLAFENQVPVEFSGYEILELKTDIRVYAFGIVGQDRSLDLSRSLAHVTHLAQAMSAFREGLGSTSPFYQFLSFYRALESVHHMRTKRNAQVPKSERRSHDETFPMPPSTDGKQLEGVMRQVAGKRFKAIKEQMRPVMRNAVAHMDPDQITKIVDRFEDFEAVIEWLPIVRYMAKRQLENELAWHLGTSAPA